MSDYFAVIPLTPPLDRQAVRRLSRHACLDVHRVTWLRSYLATDGATMLCWYQARDAESVRLVLRQQGSRGAAVWPAEVSDDAARDALSRNDAARDTIQAGAGAADASQAPLGSDAERIVVELDLAAPSPEEIAATRAAVVAALESGGRALGRVLMSKDGARLLCVVDGADVHAVAACLRAAGLASTRVWPCIEIDPRPPKLFGSQAAPQAPSRSQDGGHTIGSTAPLEHRNSAEHAGAGARSELDAVIIGAGMSGICMLERLIRMGLRVRVYESASDVGGVWHWNRYPGARVDSEVYTYGFSFSHELLRDWEWREIFAAQPEISSYLRHVADRFDLRRHVRFDTRVTAARYDGPGSRWTLETDAGERTTARYLIAAAGTLSAPQLPDYPGLDDFSGQSCHTARWPAAGVELAGKRVGVVGTGASGVQVIQTIAADVRQLIVFQRTPTYCMPQRNRPLDEDERRRIRSAWHEILAACRESYGGFVHTFDPRSGLAVSAEEREAKFEELWQKPGFAFWFGNFADLLMNPEVNAHASEFLRRKIRARVHDPDIARKLLPEHPFGTKRVPLENGYYEVYNRSNVRLVDLRETPIERITQTGILTSREEHRLDLIVFATGFDAGTGALTRIDIRGERGLTLSEKWRDGAKTFLGLLVSGFPNLFIVNGPHNAAALCNAGRCIEQNVDWIARCIERVGALGYTRIEPAPAAEDEWTTHVYETADASVLKHNTNSWFFGANTPGKACRATIYAAGAREYREHCEDVARAGYPGITMC